MFYIHNKYFSYLHKKYLNELFFFGIIDKEMMIISFIVMLGRSV